MCPLSCVTADAAKIYCQEEGLFIDEQVSHSSGATSNSLVISPITDWELKPVAQAW